MATAASSATSSHSLNSDCPLGTATSTAVATTRTNTHLHGTLGSRIGRVASRIVATSMSAKPSAHDDRSNITASPVPTSAQATTSQRAAPGGGLEARPTAVCRIHSRRCCDLCHREDRTSLGYRRTPDSDGSTRRMRGEGSRQKDPEEGCRVRRAQVLAVIAVVVGAGVGGNIWLLVQEARERVR